MAKNHRAGDEFREESPTVQDYVKTIYGISHDLAHTLVTTGQVANQLGVSCSSVTDMFKKLAHSGLLIHEAHHGVRLTAAGEQLAARVLRRQRVVESFFAQVLGLDKRDVQPEAEQLEHAVSEALVDRMEKFLSQRQRDA